MKSNFVLSKLNINIAIIIIVNFLFCIKYLSRISEYYIPLSIMVSAVYLYIPSIIRKIAMRYNSGLYWINPSLLLTFLGFSWLIFSNVDASSINVDRWSVISSFWEHFFSGKYAYFAKSNVGNVPGPMPFYFLIALPFYLFGELGYLSVAGLFVFYFVLRMSKLSKSSQTLGLMMVMSSVCFLWEIVCRSSLFLNGALVLFAIIYIQSIQKFTAVKIILSGIVVGLVLSTRNVYVIPFIITFLYQIRYYKIKIVQVIGLGTVAVFCFGLTFLPFVIGHFQDFLIMNPFVVQSTFLIPFQYTLVFIATAVFLGFICNSAIDVYFYSAVTLFLSIALYFLYHIFILGLEVAFFGSVADISYFILCLPFAIYYYIALTDHSQNRLKEQANQ